MNVVSRQVRAARVEPAGHVSDVWRVILSAGVLALASIMMAASASGEPAVDLPALQVGITASPVVDPAIASAGGATAAYLQLAYAPLFHMKPDGSIEAGLAQSWRYVPASKKSGLKNKVFEFTLRKGVRFSNGDPVTAQAVATWLQHVATAPGPFSTYLGAKPTITAVGKYTVRLRLTVPNAQLPTILSGTFNWGYVAAPEAVADSSQYASHTFGAGPYMLDASQSVSGDHYTFVPNPNYYDKSAVKFSQVTLKVISTPSSMLQAIQTGQIDLAFGDPSTVTAAKSAGLFLTAAEQATEGLFFADANGTVPSPISDVRVRQALNWAVDRKAMTSALLGGYGTPTSEIVSSDATEPKYMKYYGYDPAKAKSLLAAAGYGSGFTLKIYAPSNFGGYTSSGIPFADAIAKYLSAVGINLDITQILSSALVSSSRSQQFPAWESFVGIRPAQLQWGTYAPGAALNAFNLNDQTINRLYYQAFKSSHPLDLWRQMYERITTQAYWLPVFAYDAFYYSNSKKITGVMTSPARLAIIDLTELRAR